MMSREEFSGLNMLLNEGLSRAVNLLSLRKRRAIVRVQYLSGRECRVYRFDDDHPWGVWFPPEVSRKMSLEISCFGIKT